MNKPINNFKEKTMKDNNEQNIITDADVPGVPPGTVMTKEYVTAMGSISMQFLVTRNGAGKLFEHSVGMNVAVLSYAYSTGDIVADASSPIKDL
jgi:hypothetical protein